MMARRLGDLGDLGAGEVDHLPRQAGTDRRCTRTERAERRDTVALHVPGAFAGLKAQCSRHPAAYLGATRPQPSRGSGRTVQADATR